ncbi:MAG: HpcH/HpaI aldolase family protein [Paracoccaceae bacterium]
MLDLPRNNFKHALAEGRQQIGLWCSLPEPYVVEFLAHTGFDWLLIDSEHTPTDLRTIGTQIAVARDSNTTLIVRPPVNDPVVIKQYLDIGAQTLLLPMVNSAEEARAAVAAMRYPPTGVRGVAGTTRASRFGLISDYHKNAHKELCLLVQVETKAALEELEAIAAVDGVDGIFIGPSDLAASLGFPGNPYAPEVVSTIVTTIQRIRATGKPAGILAFDEEYLHACIAQGTTFTAVGGDIALLIGGARNLAGRFKKDT